MLPVFLGKDLEGHIAMQLNVLGPENHSHSARAYPGLKAVMR